MGPEPVLADTALWAFMAYEDWRKATTLSPRAIEQVVWSDRHGFAGTMDLYAEVTLDGVAIPAVLDWKSGKGIYAEALLQNAAYVQALIEMGHAAPPVAGVIVRLPKVETDPAFEVRVTTARSIRRCSTRSRLSSACGTGSRRSRPPARPRWSGRDGAC